MAPSRAPTAFSKTTDVKVSTIADGKVVDEAIKAAPMGKMDAMEAAAAQFAAPVGHGLDVTGTVKNYVDVTDEMLKHPADGEWLMYRRNYAGWSYSPAQADHARECEDPDPEMGLEHERGRRQPGDADHPFRGDVPVQHLQHRAGAGCAAPAS